MRRLTVWIACLTVAMLTMALVLATAAHAQGNQEGTKAMPLIGDWTGEMPAGGVRLTVMLQVTKAGATVSIPDQGLFNAPADPPVVTGNAVSFEVPSLHVNWQGTLSPDGKTLAGTLKQAVAIPLTFTRYDAARPQTPKPPFPYRVEEVAFDTAPGVRLAGTLTLPKGKGPFPAAVMIVGSGQHDRDETIFGHKPFAVIADALTRRGVAVLRLDSRGAGGSTGDFAKATTEDFAHDTAAAVAFLRARPDIAPARVGLIGHSEGGMIGPMVAAKDPKIAFVVMLAGPGVPFRELMPAQRAALNNALGVPAQVTAGNEALVGRAEAATIGAKDPADAQARIRAALAGMNVPPPLMDRIVRQVASPGYLSMLADDGRSNLAKLRMPVLALVGSKDLQVPAAQNIPALKADLKDDPKATVMELPNLNHLFQDADKGLVSEYLLSSQTISPKALEAITDWVAAHSKG
jgi:hypothetical protein